MPHVGRQIRMRRWCANQWQLSWDSASYQKRNNTRSSLKNTSYYCYKAQLQFVGWLKQHLRRTGFRGQRCLPGGEGESCPGSWHLNKLLERSRCNFQTQARPSPVEKGAGYWWLSGCTVSPAALWKSIFWDTLYVQKNKNQAVWQVSKFLVEVLMA